MRRPAVSAKGTVVKYTFTKVINRETREITFVSQVPSEKGSTLQRNLEQILSF